MTGTGKSGGSGERGGRREDGKRMGETGGHGEWESRGVGSPVSMNFTGELSRCETSLVPLLTSLSSLFFFLVLSFYLLPIIYAFITMSSFPSLSLSPFLH